MPIGNCHDTGLKKIPKPDAIIKGLVIRCRTNALQKLRSLTSGEIFISTMTERKLTNGTNTAIAKVASVSLLFPYSTP